MKENLTDITIVLDRSGSMDSIKNDTIGGFNSFLSDQQKADGEGLLTLVQFDDRYEVQQDAVNLKSVQPLNDKTFSPRGSTALLDAIGRTIQSTGKRLDAMPEGEKPAKIVFVIITDGFENASKTYNQHHINDMIAHQRDVYQWEFVFLAANQDAISTASGLGINAANAMTYAANSAGAAASMDSLSRNLVSYRSGVSKNVSFSSEDRQKQVDAGVKKSA
jgi:uncharacterized protein YegL